MTEDDFRNCLFNVRFLAAATDMNTVFQMERKEERRRRKKEKMEEEEEEEEEEAAIITGLTEVEMNLALMVLAR
ncbi:hypothetical protein MDA_GLEAN10024682 [Myotis davidii]|uniref:Uncharacterized protein n=1 Tax=Myotis davidii TaxID=225400 RepID=L5LWC4_MYODS|nr:hypothetical protein MDA_GLEAN10024682 [Myotis davidii]